MELWLMFKKLDWYKYLHLRKTWQYRSFLFSHTLAPDWTTCGKAVCLDFILREKLPHSDIYVYVYIYVSQVNVRMNHLAQWKTEWVNKTLRRVRKRERMRESEWRRESINLSLFINCMITFLKILSLLPFVFI